LPPLCPLDSGFILAEVGRGGGLSVDDVERKLLDKLYALMYWEARERDPQLKRALERDVYHCLVALRLWRTSREEIERAEGDGERYTGIDI
jgi:hypothetical protein